MYWTNSRIECTWPGALDPITQSQHGGAHCLFYDPAVPVRLIRYQQTLQDISDWANCLLQRHGIQGFVQDPLNHYDIANIVKLNMWIADIRTQGVVKPMMLFYDGQERYGINNGESRLRALERIPAIHSVQAFVSTSSQHQDRFEHLVPVTRFDQFAILCGAEPGQKFLFTLTDPDAAYGVFWYEYNSQRTAPVTPDESYCVEVLHLYLTQHPEVEFTPEWFDTLIDWNHYKSNN